MILSWEDITRLFPWAHHGEILHDCHDLIMGRFYVKCTVIPEFTLYMGRLYVSYIQSAVIAQKRGSKIFEKRPLFDELIQSFNEGQEKQKHIIWFICIRNFS